MFSFVLTATCYQYVKYFRKNFISTQFVTKLSIWINKVIDKKSTFWGMKFTAVLWVCACLINLYKFPLFRRISLCHKLSRNIRTGSSLKIYFCFAMKQNFGFHIFTRGKREKTKKRNKRNFHRNTRTTVSEYWVEEKAKKENSSKAATNVRSIREINSGSLGFPMENSKAEPWKVLTFYERGGEIRRFSNIISSEFCSELISPSPSCCLFYAVTAINTIQRYTI